MIILKKNNGLYFVEFNGRTLSKQNNNLH